MAQGTCTIEGCDKPCVARGWCEKHYTRWRRTGTTEARRKAFDLTVTERIEAALDKSGDCWIWTAKIRTGSGYPVLSVDGRQQFVHRLVYEQAHGPIPAGVEVDHRCRQRRCCNPAHLRLATRAQQVQNTSLRYDNTTGAKGVFLDKRTGRYYVQVVCNGRTHHGGMFSTVESAKVAAIELRNRLFTHNEADRIA